MALQTTTIARTTFPIGTTQTVRTLSGAAITTFAVDSDVTAVVNPCTLQVGLEYSEDAGATWHGASGITPTPLPTTNDDGNTVTDVGCSETFGVAVHPNRVRWTVTATGNSIPLGPTTVNAS